MIPCALETEQRWLQKDVGRLRELLRLDNLACAKHHCEFTKALQSRLRAFDHDDSLITRSESTSTQDYDHCSAYQPWTESTRLYIINPRRALLAATRDIFKEAPPRDGVDHDLAMHGITSLDRLEKHRVVLVDAVKDAMAPAGHAADAASSLPALLRELDSAATLHHGLFHMGFRATVLIHALDPRRPRPMEHIMATLNALFPPAIAAEVATSSPLPPYSDGLRENIRFSVYEHLMRGEADDAAAWRALQTRLFTWCGMPGYADARDALLRYAEEFKKTELLCLSTLHALERRCGVPSSSSSLPSPVESLSFLTSCSASSRSSAAATAAVSPNPSSVFLSDRPDTSSLILRDSLASSGQAMSLSSSTAVAHRAAPLLRGMPGREVSVAKTDGAAFAGDVDAPPVLAYPDDLSRREFDRHPLAPHLGISPREQMQLGLGEEEEEDCEGGGYSVAGTPRPPAREKSKRRRFGRKGSDPQAPAPPPVPPLPPIPEALRPNLTAGNFGRIVRRMRSKSSLAASDRDSTTRTTSVASISSAGEPAAKTPRKLKMPFIRRSARAATISSPELQPASHDYASPFDSDWAAFATSQGPTPASSARQSVASPGAATMATAAEEQEAVQWRLAPARMSPMEFARSRLIRAALQRRGNNVSSSSGLTKRWFWTPRWEAFLVLPSRHLPSLDASPDRPREMSVLKLTPGPEQNAVLEHEIPQGEPDRRSFLSCPRLSLNLGGIALQFPSMLNLVALDGIHPFRSLSGPAKSASPPGATDKSRVARRSGVYAQQTEVASGLDTLHLGSPNQKAKQDYHFSSPAVHYNDRRRLQDGTENPSQDTASSSIAHPYRPATSQASSSPSAGSSWDLGRRRWCNTTNSGDGDGRGVADNNAAAAPRNFGPAATSHPGISAVAVRRRLRQHLAYDFGSVTPVAARRVGTLVAGRSVASLHAESEDFALPDAAEEERVLRPPPLQVPRRRPGGGGLRERDTTRRNLFRGDGEDDWRGLLRHLGDGVADGSPPPPPLPAPWAPLRLDDQPTTPSRHRRSSMLSHLSMTPTALRLVGSPCGQDDEEEEGGVHSGFSARQRKVASTYQPLPDSPTLPVVGPQKKDYGMLTCVAWPPAMNKTACMRESVASANKSRRFLHDVEVRAAEGG
ncbi:hypothetical protein ISF_03879 [Cordyceps fumosorosea ARSEF 2679]|uniref:Uncharacterized protein n=1 Tax=Cordyceps fumosorosea (strain ARSEF 2679) TaxID=1081104 RepID=A0A167Y9W9_CORFA|nr:hypothetical protein ISF_03879 [Cordyceps fumosorosea ARSEF 2679]OAA66041.1 hypothetical protein ISF_03879 [Cordyceps fumosorosea ARSEF 2679]